MAHSSLEIEKLALPGVLLIQPKRFDDERGFFVETFHQEALRAAGITHPFVQDNLSFSQKNVLRGLHFQKKPHVQARLVRCAYGEILDVAADHNPESATFGKSVAVTLSGEMQTMLYIPAAYAHGFCVLSDAAVVEYKVSDYYYPESASGVLYDDPIFAIAWPIKDPILSTQDTQWSML
ncbi:MAG: dTDP-4-dehydrorhamnose 3,5-epimerase [Parcubacteria group bacterium Gr01-1014_91]|nr:MAG: dTDP-4-dehydrorhamnose 3,5-epimerase [Parcubacteria group bacterium Gr01-1014_91]